MGLRIKTTPSCAMSRRGEAYLGPGAGVDGAQKHTPCRLGPPAPGLVRNVRAPQQRALLRALGRHRPLEQRLRTPIWALKGGPCLGLHPTRMLAVYQSAAVLQCAAATALVEHPGTLRSNGSKCSLPGKCLHAGASHLPVARQVHHTSLSMARGADGADITAEQHHKLCEQCTTVGAQRLHRHRA